MGQSLLPLTSARKRMRTWRLLKDLDSDFACYLEILCVRMRHTEWGANMSMMVVVIVERVETVASRGAKPACE